MLLEVNAYLFIYLFILFIYLIVCLFVCLFIFILFYFVLFYLFIYLFIFLKSGLTGFKMQRACKLIMLVLIVYSGCENEIDLQTLIL